MYTDARMIRSSFGWFCSFALLLAPARALCQVTQVESPSANAASPALLDRLDSPRFGMAFDQPVAPGDPSPALTLTLSPGLPDDARERVALRTTLGGPTPQGDGDWPLRGHETPRHVTAEVKIPVLGGGPGSPGNTRLGLSLLADTFGTGYGRDLYAATALLEAGDGFMGNVAYRQQERLHHGQRDHDFKLCVGKVYPFHIGRERLDLTMGGGALVRERSQRNAALASARIDCPIGDRWRVTGALFTSTASQRTDHPHAGAVLGLGFER